MDKGNKADKEKNKATNKATDKATNTRCFRLIIIVIFISLLLFVIASIKERSAAKKAMYIERPKYGEGVQRHSLYVRGQKEQLEQEYTINFEVRAAEPSAKEQEMFFSGVLDYACRKVLGENEGAEYITEDLQFFKELPGVSARIDWELDDYSLFEVDGKRNEKKPTAEGQEVELTCTVSYDDIERKRVLTLRVFPRRQSIEEEMLEEITQRLSEIEEDRAEQGFQLPERVGEIELEWRTDEHGSSHIFLLMGIAAIILMPVALKMEEERLRKRKMLQLQMDYPYIVDKFLILLTAGMTIRAVWERLANDYERNRGKGSGRVAYEELLRTRNELIAGIPERRAYEDFGKRCGQLSYIRFSTLMAQNLRKGSRGVLPLLKEEAQNAFDDRKQTALRMGEEASTRLTFPMVGFLIIVMLLVIVPALQII